MKPYVFYALVLLAGASALPAPVAAQPRVPPALSATPCDSVSDTPFAGEMLLFNVSVDGGGNTATVAANDSFTVSFDYYVQVCDSPASRNYCQVVVGYASSPSPLFCIFRSRVDCNGETGSLAFRMKAPAFPAEYIVAFDLQRTIAEGSCPASWPQGPPVHDRYLACVNVDAGNIPVPLTGTADNVTHTSATLHGTVHPAGSPTTVRFLYGASPGGYTDSVTAFESPVTGSLAVSVSGGVSGLSANTTYYYRATAENENGYNTGGEESFFTGSVFTLSEQVHSFGHLGLNASLTDSVTVSNDGNAPLQITSVVPLSGQYAVSPLAANIAPLSSRKFAVTFSPPAYGTYNSGIVFVHNGPSVHDTLFVRGDVPIGGVSAGWNIVAVPLTVPDPRKTEVFPGAVSNAFEFSAGYVARDTVRNGRGYWLKFPSTDSLVVAGDLRNFESVTVVPGWNMIGGPSLDVPLDSVVATPPGIVAGNFFEYAAGYNPVAVLRPGKGYWVKVNAGGTLSLRGVESGPAPDAGARPPVPEGFAALTVTDADGAVQRLYVSAAAAGDLSAFVLPPPPPEGAFDVRFDGDRYAAAPAGSGKDARLAIRGARYPVSIAWTSAGEGTTISAGGGVATMEGPGSILLQEAGPVVLGAAPAGRASAPPPGTSGLTGNYPNPFNPSTVIGFTLPSAGPVRLGVFNTLGEEVAVLIDGVRDAGTWTVDFDASGLPGGVYFCRLQGAGPVSTMKMVLMK
jgi:hypothetical protein